MLAKKHFHVNFTSPLKKYVFAYLDFHKIKNAIDFLVGLKSFLHSPLW